MNPGRPLALLVLSGLLIGTFVHYGTVADRYDPSPSTAELASDYQAHVGDEVYLWARVIEVRPSSLLVQSGSVTLQVMDRPARVATGDTIQIYGRVAAERRLIPDRMIVSSATSLLALYLVSAVGALLAAWAFLDHWTVDRRRLAIVPRGEGG